MANVSTDPHSICILCLGKECLHGLFAMSIASGPVRNGVSMKKIKWVLSDFAFSIDLKDAYGTLRLQTIHRFALCFSGGGKGHIYQF